MADFTIGTAPNSRFQIGGDPADMAMQRVRDTQPKTMSWGEVGSQAVANLVPSTMQFLQNTYQAIRHPVVTAKAVGETALGEAEKVANLAVASRGNQAGAAQPKTDPEKHADAVNAYFANRYGSIEGFKKAVATDPVGVASDISAVATLGGEGLVRAPGLAGKIGAVVKTAGEVTNPLGLAGKAAKAAGPLAAGFIGHLGTHTGSQALKLAAAAGAKGGQAAQSFAEHLRGNASIEDIVSSAKEAVKQLRRERSAAYQAGMKTVSNDKTVLDFKDIDAHIAKTSGVKKFGTMDLSPKTAGIRQEISDAINHWKSLDPAMYHTPEGFDALKQYLSDIRDHTVYGTPERLIADQAYHAVRDTIVKQAPVYGKVMKDYEQASHILDEMQKTLSLNPKASVDTTARKLLSILRNNVNTNFGRRAELGKILEKHGAPELPYQLAGETLSKVSPRGLGGYEAGLPLLAAWAMHNPWLVSALPFMSPRLMGEAAYGLGKASSNPVVRQAPNAALVARALGGMQTPQDVANQVGPQ